ncbi:MAG: T9SS type A sorting domain-containing protein [Bacteroidetes bacterium]|nr:T9SS type A sorting domain-containing protein [Bacteroidota bacterium]
MRKTLRSMQGILHQRGRMGRMMLAVLLLVSAGDTLLAQATTFSYTGGVQTYTVPPGVISVTIDAKGAQGGGITNAPGGMGGRAQGSLSVTPGQVLEVYVGGAGAFFNSTTPTGGYNGGAGFTAPSSGGTGGGGSDVRISPYGLANRVIVGGGGGGGTNSASQNRAGGAGGGLIGGDGGTWNTWPQSGGKGGTQSAGGAAGVACCHTPQAGSFGAGGRGEGDGACGAGGGGGWYGGGGGLFGGGGGGSSYIGGVTGGTLTSGFRLGNGEVVITPDVIVPPCATPSNVTAIPSMICPGGSADMNATSVGNTISWFTVPSGGVAIGSSASGANFVVTPTVTTTYYAEATGGSCSNSPRIAVTVTVDNVAPTANCQAVTVTLDVNGNGTVTAAAVGSGSTDNCTINSLNLSQSAFTCGNVGSNAVTLTVTDANGNTSTCVTNITVVGQNPTTQAWPDSSLCGYHLTCPGGNDGIAHVSGSGGCGNDTYLWSNGATTATISGLAAGVYYVTVTDAGGGTAVDSVTILSPPAILTNAGVTSTCAGDTAGMIDLSPSGGNDCLGYSYVWSTGDSTQDLVGLAPGSYTVTVTDGAGCSATQTFTVVAIPAPTPTLSQNGNSVICTPTYPTMQWLLNGNNISGANGGTYIVTQSGSYSIMVTDSNGCTAVSDTLFVTFVGIDAGMGNFGGLSLYPNPVSRGIGQGELRLRTASPIVDAFTVKISDMFGRQLQVQTLPELHHEVAIDIQHLTPGTYLVEVTSGVEQRRMFKVVVQ